MASFSRADGFDSSIADTWLSFAVLHFTFLITMLRRSPHPLPHDRRLLLAGHSPTFLSRPGRSLSELERITLGASSIKEETEPANHRLEGKGVGPPVLRIVAATDQGCSQF